LSCLANRSLVTVLLTCFSISSLEEEEEDEGSTSTFDPFVDATWFQLLPRILLLRVVVVVEDDEEEEEEEFCCSCCRFLSLCNLELGW
jgi:hypothetical protein